VAFAQFYLDALEADLAHGTVSGPWAAAFASAGIGPPSGFSPRLRPRSGPTSACFAVRAGKVRRRTPTGSPSWSVDIPAGTLVKPHSHAREDEFSLVQAGTVGVRIGDQVLAARADPASTVPRRSTTSWPRTTGSRSKTTGSRSWNRLTASSSDTAESDLPPPLRVVARFQKLAVDRPCRSWHLGKQRQMLTERQLFFLPAEGLALTVRGMSEHRKGRSADDLARGSMAR
jgi:hypothetical protein